MLALGDKCILTHGEGTKEVNIWNFPGHCSMRLLLCLILISIFSLYLITAMSIINFIEFYELF